VKKKWKVVFAGTPDFSLPSLAALARDHELLWVYTQPDAPRGRGQRLLPSPVKKWAVDNDIPCYQPDRLGKVQAQDLVDNSVDIMIVAAYGQLIPVSVLNAPRFGCVNVHASLLPRWRGASPIQHAILHEDQEAGVCIMEMEKGLDSGAVLAVQACTLTGQETAGTLTQDLADMGAAALSLVMEDIPGFLARRQPQDNALVTYAPKLAKQDAAVTWDQPVTRVLAHVRAFNPWPTAFTWIGSVRIKVFAASAWSHPQGFLAPAGTWAVLDDKLVIACEDGWLAAETIQLPGKKPVLVDKTTILAVRSHLPQGVLCRSEPE
jgi:methionyl-tRNA formyltransferase